MPSSPCCKRKYSKPCKCRSPCNNCECIVQAGQCPPSSTTDTEEDVPVPYSTVIAASPPSKKCCCTKCCEEKKKIRSRSPCNNCECIVQAGQCPPSSTTETEEDAPMLYTPVIAAAPPSRKCCCTKCCEEKKQRKSLWQQLFGDRKCCSSSQKKKQDCFCKPKKKQKTVCEYTNQLCCSSCKPSFPPASKSCKPLCCCKVKTCKCKTSCKPICPTPTSLFGCSFYCNVENRENRTKQTCRCSCCCTCDKRKRLSQSSEVTSAIPVTSEDEKITDNYIYNKSSNKGGPTRSGISPTQSRKTTKDTLELPPENIIDKPIQKHSVKPSHSNIHIGLTVTNTGTKYYKKRSNNYLPIEEETKHKNNENEESSGSSEQIITLEIHQSDENMGQDRNERQGNSQNRDEETSSIDSSKRRRLSALEEENKYSKVKSESFSREILPSVERRSRVEHENTSFDSLSKKREKMTLSDRRQDPERLEDIDLDNRVSEILKRLRTIENKLNKINMHQTENKNYKFDIDDKKSYISFHFKDGKHNDSVDSNNSYRTSNGKNSRMGNTIIEIRKTRSNSYSPVRKHSPEIKKYRYSRSLDRDIRAQREKPKVVIKLPHGNKVSEGTFSLSNSKRVKYIDRDHEDPEWVEISNELKNRNHTNTRCYCYECMCQRIRC